MKNYYEILEVDRKASPEVIEKVYKMLVKKYHPDLQNNENLHKYEEKMKEINEAYSILSDDFKRREYDESLQETTITREEYEKILLENQSLRQLVERMEIQLENGGVADNQERVSNAYGYNPEYSQQEDNVSGYNTEDGQQANNAYAYEYNQQDYDTANGMDGNNHDMKYYAKAVLAVFVVCLILLLIYQIPFVKSFCHNLYEENIIIKAIVDLIKGDK